MCSHKKATHNQTKKRSTKPPKYKLINDEVGINIFFWKKKEDPEEKKMRLLIQALKKTISIQ